MKNIDLLFITRHADVCDEYLTDVAFDRISEILSEKDYSVLTEVIKTPLTDADNIIERQKIFQDLTTYPGLAENLIFICNNAQKNKLPFYGIHSSVPLNEKFKEYLKMINHTLNIPAELLSAMREKDFNSTALNDLHKQLKKINEINILKARLNTLADTLMGNNIALQIVYSDTFKLKRADVYSGGHIKAIRTKKGIFRKNQESQSYPYEYGYDFIAALQTDEMINSGVNKFCSAISQLNSYILSTCQKLSNHLTFYTAGIKLINFIKNTGAQIVYPKFSDARRSITTAKIYDAGLVIQRKSISNIIPNDFKGDENCFYLISGVNQGGKTTFLKSIGTAQLLAQNGFPVPAEEYVCPVFNSFITHFPRDEDENLNYGKLAEELSRFRRYVPRMADKALILMNESFATTTEREGAEIAADTLRALSIVKPYLFFVTHNITLDLMRNQNERSKLQIPAMRLNLMPKRFLLPR